MLCTALYGCSTNGVTFSLRRKKINSALVNGEPKMPKGRIKLWRQSDDKLHSDDLNMEGIKPRRTSRSTCNSTCNSTCTNRTSPVHLHVAVFWGYVHKRTTLAHLHVAVLTDYVCNEDRSCSRARCATTVLTRT